MINKRKLLLFLTLSFFILSPVFANSGTEADLVEKMTDLVFQVGFILFAAKLGGFLVKKIGMPSVLGELLMGIIIGPYLLGGLHFPGFPQGVFPLINPEFPVSPELYGLSTVASIILLFHSGLETDLSLFLRYSLKGAIIGIGGVLLSFFTGAWAGSLLTGEALFAPINLFLGVLSIATSVGITARILSEQRKMDSPEGVTILAAAVIDDVLGIIILAIVLGIIAVLTGHGGDGVHWGAIGFIALKAIGVWLGFMALGLVFARKIGQGLKIFKSETSIGVMSLGLALILSGIFEKAGLAMIIGAYVMGLSLSRTDISFVIQEKMHPLQEFFVPIFFCVMGMLVDVQEIIKPEIFMAGLFFSFIGILAKVIGCGLPSLFLGFNGLGALRIGVGMIPRGEVALIIAGIGISSGILNSSQFGVAVLMTLITTIIPPPLLTYLLKKPKIGTKRAMKGSSTVSTFYDFSSKEMNRIALSSMVSALESEGFYTHEMEIDHPIYQIRKDEVFLTIHHHPSNIEIISDPEDVSYVKAVVYESMVELNETLNKVKDTAKPEKLKQELVENTKGRVQETFFHHISEESILTSLKGRTKREIIKELVKTLEVQETLADPKACLEAVFAREESMSTGMQNGIALPHGKSDGVKGLHIAIGLSKEGVDFDALDGQLSHIFILTLSPKEATGPHIQFLSSVSTILNKKDMAQRILNCPSSKEVKDLLIEEAHI